MPQVAFLYRIDIGLDKERGYAASVTDVQRSTEERHMVKGIRGNSIEQIMSRLRHALIEEEGKRRRFPLESESRIITNGY